ncbi:hypothetical protein ABZ372_29845, partial [Streptomyces sp. NPDC005921]
RLMSRRVVDAVVNLTEYNRFSKGLFAINYNREPGTSPLDWTRPLGTSRGGGIWLHVDHGGPTHACVSVAKAHMRELLRTLDPDRHPVVVMGHADWLAR